MEQIRENKYGDIIGLSHHVSVRHRPMKYCDRAAQFAPFAALTGYEACIAEKARLTERKLELDENMKFLLDIKLRFLREHIMSLPKISVTYFVPDDRKTGGKYVTESFVLRKIDEYSQSLVSLEGKSILICNILEISLAGERGMD